MWMRPETQLNVIWNLTFFEFWWPSKIGHGTNLFSRLVKNNPFSSEIVFYIQKIVLVQSSKGLSIHSPTSKIKHTHKLVESLSPYQSS